MSSVKKTRREFLRTSTSLITAAGFTPYLFSSAQPARAKGPNERLNLAAIGTSQYRTGIWNSDKPQDGRGTVVGRHAAQFGNMVAAADVYRPFAEKFASYFPAGQCRACTDYHELIADKTIDAVFIGTPDHWHVKIAIEAMKAGKHVYVEKPLSLTMDETRKIVQVAKETGKVVQVGSQQRTENDSFRKAAAICRSGRLGTKLSVRTTYPIERVSNRGIFDVRTPFKPEPIPEGLDWNLWLGQAPVADYFLERCFYNFRYWLAYSGGVITDWGGHNVDFATWALNMAAPVEISGTGKFPNVPGWYDVAEEFEVNFKYANGTTLQIRSAPENNRGLNEVIVEGELGRIRVNRGSLTGKPVEALTKKDEEELAEIMDALMKGKKSGDHIRNFFEAIEDNTLPVSDVFSTASGINMCHIANICLRTGRTLRWNQEKYEFENDPEATAMIARKPREGFEIDA
jgi:predicted dehydrogenase